MHKIVNLVNKTFNSYNATSDIFSCPRVAQEMSLKSFKEVGLKLNSIFQTMPVDCRRHFHPKYSQNILIKMIIQKFVSMRIWHLCRLKNERKKTSIRQKSNKLILFKHE